MSSSAQDFDDEAKPLRTQLGELLPQNIGATSLLAARVGVLREAAERAVTYVERAGERSVFPGGPARRLLDGFPRDLPEFGRDPLAVVAELDELGSAATVVYSHGRFFGFVNGGVDPAAGGAALLASVWDQNVALPVMSPVGAHLDAIAARWVCELLGLPTNAVATFCAGASIANLTCIIAARDSMSRRLGWSVDRDGLHGAPVLRVVTSEEIHISVKKALRAAGIGSNAIEYVPTDSCGRIDVAKIPALDDHTLVLLQAGNVNTGHSDPFDEVIPLAHDARAWVHVDGAFGLWAAASPSKRHLVSGVEQADSWATDAHKWLNAPYDAGIAICARDEDLRNSMAFDAAYLETNDDRPLMHLSLQMSQKARGVETWAVIASRGRAGVATIIDDTCTHAQRFAERLSAAGVQILAPIVLNQVLAHFDDDATTDATIAAIQADGTCWAGPSTWKTKRVMRISVSDAATTEADVDASIEAMLRCWNRVRSQRV